MVDYRNILRLHSQGNSQREIEREVNSSRHTISEVLIQAEAAGITWPLDDLLNYRWGSAPDPGV